MNYNIFSQNIKILFIYVIFKIKNISIYLPEYLIKHLAFTRRMN